MQVEVLNTAEINPDTKEQLLQFAPFKKEESAVYGLICPKHSTKTAQQLLDDKDLPLRVREVVEMTKDRFTKGYAVWESDSYEVKDPILLGLQENKQYSWQTDYFFLARWGSELESFSLLKEKAKKLLARSWKTTILKYKAACDAYLTDIEAFAEEALEQGQNTVPSMTSSNIF